MNRLVVNPLTIDGNNQEVVGKGLAHHIHSHCRGLDQSSLLLLLLTNPIQDITKELATSKEEVWTVHFFFASAPLSNNFKQKKGPIRQPRQSRNVNGKSSLRYEQRVEEQGPS